MELLEQMKVVNLDNIDENAVVTVTVEGERLIFSKAKLFAKLKPRGRKPLKAKSGKRES